MFEVVLEGLAKHLEDGTIQTWFVEEGDPVNEGDDLVEVSTSDGTFTIPSPKTGILAEVYFDEGEVAARGEILCNIDDEDEALSEDDEEDEDEDEEEESGDEEAEEKDDEDEDEKETAEEEDEE